MKRQNGFAEVGLFYWLVIVALIISVVFLSTHELKGDALIRRIDAFEQHFGVRPPFVSPTTPLTKYQKWVLEPLVAKRLSEICALPPATQSTEPAVVQRQLALDVVQKRCADARRVAEDEGVLPAEE